MRWIVCLSVFVGCGSNNGFPTPPGENTPDAGSASRSDAPRADAAAPPVDASTMLSAHVCALLDPRSLSQCATAGLANLMVTLDGVTVSTDDTGGFSIARPVSTDPYWTVTGTGFTTSVTGFSDQALVPAMPTSIYGELATNSNVTLVTGDGTIIVYLVHDGQPAQLDTVSVESSTTSYAESSPTAWLGAATGPSGAAWITNVVPGEPTMTSGTATEPVRIEANAVSFAVMNLP